MRAVDDDGEVKVAVRVMSASPSPYTMPPPEAP